MPARDYLKELLENKISNNSAEFRSYIEAHNKEHLALDVRVLERFDAHRKEHELMQRALDKAEAGMNDRLLSMNELRSQITAERGSYITRTVLDDKLLSVGNEVETKSTSNQNRVEILERMVANWQGRLWMLGVGLAALTFIINITVAVLLKWWK